MVSVDFARPIYLWLTIFIPFLFIAHFYFLHRTQKKAMRFANFQTLKRIAGGRLVTRNNTLLILRFIVLLGAIVALSGMTVYYEGPRNDFDYVLAIDTSSSMLAKDIEPTRIGAAKDAALTFLDVLDTKSSVGLVAFSGVTYVMNTFHDERINTRLNIASLNISRTSGTDISGAIIASSNLFNDPDVGKSIIIMTDGMNTVGSFLDDDLEEAAAYAASQKIVIHAIGLGTDEAPVGYLPEIFNLTTSIDRTSLEILTTETGGTILYPETADDLKEFFQTLDQKYTIASIPFHADKVALFVVFIALGLEWILMNFLFRRIA